MHLKSAIENFKGLRYMIDNLSLQSNLARRHLHAQEYMTDVESIEKALKDTEQMMEIMQSPANKTVLSIFKHTLAQIKDIRATARNIRHKILLDDIQLFEIKYFALLCIKVKESAHQLNITFIEVPDLTPVVEILDPEKQKLPSFYIYNTYSEELTKLRTLLKQEQRKLKNLQGEEYQNQNQLIEEIHQQCLSIEENIRVSLLTQLHNHAAMIDSALQTVAQLDIVTAKADQAQKLHLCKPIISSEKTIYKSLFYPVLRERLEAQKKHYQAIDIMLEKAPCLITGANMTGKTILLKSIALSQILMQFGFFVPASYAEIVPVEDILLCMESDQSDLSGLSSFAAEMMNVNSIIEKIRQNKKVLVLIDELARTTNPYEGRAIVNAMLDILQEHHTQSLITTHYGVQTSCRKLRVKGFIQNRITEALNIHNMHDFIDYSLVDETQNEVPMEALRVASALGVDKTLVEKAMHYLEK